MTAGTIFGCIVITFALIVLGVLSVISLTEKRKIKISLVPGAKFVFYGNCGGGDPFREANITFTIIQVKAGYVLYHISSDAPKLMPSMMTIDNERSSKITEFVNRIYKTKEVTIIMPKNN